MIIDSHVHLRDWKEESGKETVRHGLEVARDSSVSAVFEMPNTRPSIFTEEMVRERIKLADNAKVPEVFHGLYLGLTKNSEQVRRAVDISRKYFPRVVGMKLYAGQSTNDLGVIMEHEQRMIYEVLSEENYDGVLVVHCEKESLIDRGKFIHMEPITHCHAQPEEAEIESVRDQIKFAREYNFSGKLHIAHVSSPETVELVSHAKQNGLDISSEICPHHFIYDWGNMCGNGGILYKMNPPLRSPESRKEVFQMLKSGKIDWIATDHAPHTLEDKTEKHMSGIPGLPSWPLFIEYLRKNDFSDKEIENLTFNNIQKRFGIDIKKNNTRIKDRTRDYAYNPYTQIENELDWNKND